MTFQLLAPSVCSRIGVYPTKAEAEAALAAQPGGPHGPGRVVRCALHSNASDAAMFHLTDAPTGRHRQTHKHSAAARTL